MRTFLGESATQAGSLNAPGRLRFDFNTPGAVPPAVLHDVEQQVNEVLMGDLEVRAFVTSQDEARRLGAMALFGEKYGDEVRVVEVGDYARELCGGTHVARSGQLGLVKILSRGVDRLRRAPGRGAGRPGRVRLPGQGARAGVPAGRAVPGPSEQVADRVEQTVAAAARRGEGAREAAGAAGARRRRRARRRGARTWAAWRSCGTEAPEGTAGNDVRTLAQEIRGQHRRQRPAVVAVAARAGGKASLIVAVNAAAKERGLAPATWSRARCPGRGGGNADLAQGGGVPADQVPALLAAVEKAGRGVPADAAGRVRPDERHCRGACGWVSMSARSGSGWPICDPDGILATPLVTLSRDLNAAGRVASRDIAELVRLVEVHESVEVVVGLPVTPRRDRGPAAIEARATPSAGAGGRAGAGPL